jgi:hypothetical protein
MFLSWLCQVIVIVKPVLLPKIRRSAIDRVCDKGPHRRHRLHSILPGVASTIAANTAFTLER